MSKLSPAHERFFARIADPKRKENQFVGILEVDGHWNLFGKLREMGMIMRKSTNDPTHWIPTPQAAAALNLTLPADITEVWATV